MMVNQVSTCRSVPPRQTMGSRAIPLEKRMSLYKISMITCKSCECVAPVVVRVKSNNATCLCMAVFGLEWERCQC